MNDLPFDRPGRFWRGNLHTYSDRSDGTPSPARVSGLTSGIQPLDTFADSAYVRVTIAGDGGGRAWSNPIWLR